ncbi:PBP1A family penicillin-binding protein [bacterium]|nr:MAG: PBP1A family penicillin-binding protein [bacterium]
MLRKKRESATDDFQHNESENPEENLLPKKKIVDETLSKTSLNQTSKYPVKPHRSVSSKKLNKAAVNPWRRAVRLFGMALVIGIFIIGFFAIYFSRDLPSIAQLEVYKPKLSTKVYSADGKVIKEFFKERRTRVPFHKMPKNVVNALLATEDHRFYNHWGVDMIRFVKAAMVNTASLSSKEGFSSLTQQLARNLYFDFEKTLSRKIKEILTAIQIEKTYSKNEIIEMYLTHMYFGNDAYGIQAAAKNFFGKDAADLTLEESAYLIGHLQAPSYYVRNPDAADRRKIIVLKRMLDCGFISRAEYDETKPRKVVLTTTREEEIVGVAPYFSEHVRQELEAMQDSLKFNIYEGGLSVFTTLDTRAQNAAENAYQESVKEKFIGLDKFGAGVVKANAKPYLTRYLQREGVDSETIHKLLQNPRSVDSLCKFYGTVQASLVAIDPTNGRILAMIGGRDFNKYKLNHVTQIARQPGSTFKPFLYTVAIDNGYSPAFKLLNQDVVLIMEDGKRWTPQNYDGKRGGPTTLRDAIARSLNLVAIRLMQEIVPAQQVVAYAQKMGIETPLMPVDALALGVSDVIPLQIVSAYGVFANKGIRVEPVSILRIEDRDGNVIYQHVPKYKEVLSAETAFIMADMMKSSIEWGTGKYARAYGFERPAGVKTGTTQKWSDGWYIGFTPQMVTGVWVGFDTYEFNLGSKNPGEVTAAPIWGRFMAHALKDMDLPVEDFEMPPGVVRLEICKESGQLAHTSCPEKIKEVFNAKFQPTDHCPIHTGGKSGKKKKGVGF